MREDHVRKRATPLGRWLPVLLYLGNYVLWIITGILVQAFNLLWLALFPLAALGLYLVRTRR